MKEMLKKLAEAHGVSGYEDEGFIRFATIGGWFDQTLLNQRVILHSGGKSREKEKVYGVIGSSFFRAPL